MSGEQLFVLAAVVLVALFNFVRQILAQRRRPAEVPQDVPAEEEVVATGRFPAVPPRVARPEPRRIPLSAAPPAPSERPRRSRRLFAGRRDARRGIVLVTVLGPCRGIESPSAPTGDIYSSTLPR
jgi:hypothetical protein